MLFVVYFDQQTGQKLIFCSFYPFLLYVVEEDRKNTEKDDFDLRKKRQKKERPDLNPNRSVSFIIIQMKLYVFS